MTIAGNGATTTRQFVRVNGGLVAQGSLGGAPTQRWTASPSGREPFNGTDSAGAAEYYRDGHGGTRFWRDPATGALATEAVSTPHGAVTLGGAVPTREPVFGPAGRELHGQGQGFELQYQGGDQSYYLPQFQLPLQQEGTEGDAEDVEDTASSGVRPPAAAHRASPKRPRRAFATFPAP